MSFGDGDWGVNTDYEMSLDEIREIIAQYEAQYGMTSAQFIAAQKDGTAPDTFETNDWQMMLDALERSEEPDDGQF